MRLLLIRHGATINNMEARYTGQLNIPLSEQGMRQVELLGSRLKDAALDALVVSDLLRAQQTAEAVNRYHGLQLQSDPDLREISMGSWEGKTFAELQETVPEHLLRWQDSPTSVAPPGGETLTEFHHRLGRALRRWSDRYKEETVAWVTHGGAIGVLLCHVLSLDLSRRWQFRRDNTSITELDIGPDYVIVMRINDTAHLAGDHLSTSTEKAQVL